MSATMSSGGSDAISGVTILLTDVIAYIQKVVIASLVTPRDTTPEADRTVAVLAAN